MKAIVFDRHGGPDVLRLVDLPVPTPKRGEVLVRVHASGVNPADAGWRRRPSSRTKPTEFPAHPGWDLVGTIEVLGPGVHGFATGDRVYGMARFPDFAGTLAEYTAVPAKHLALAPATLDDAQAGALPLVGLTALQAFNRGGGIRRGSRVLIDNGAGGVGHIAIQLAKAMGAYVVTTASDRNSEFVLGLGADEVIDYAVADVFATQAQFDFILHSRGKGWFDTAFDSLAPDGALISITGGVPRGRAFTLGFTGLTVANYLVAPDPEGLVRVAELVDEHGLRVAIDADFPLEEAAAAHARVESGHVVGKVVVTMPEA